MNDGEKLANLFEEQRIEKQKQIQEWNERIGPPHNKITIEEDGIKRTIGFWKVEGGIFKIQANVKGVFDPFRRVEITDKEIETIIKTHKGVNK